MSEENEKWVHAGIFHCDNTSRHLISVAGKDGRPIFDKQWYPQNRVAWLSVTGNLELERKRTCLIKAAPELLAALKAVCEDYKRLGDSGDAGFWNFEELECAKQARAAIAKAEGIQ